MVLYVKQRVFSFRDRFTVKDANGIDRYSVVGDVFSFPKTLHIYQANGEEILTIKKKMFSFLPCYQIYRKDTLAAKVIKKFTFFTPSYCIEGTPFTVKGDFMEHNYEILRDGIPVADISKEFFTWGDSYRINVGDGEDDLMMLAILIIIDCMTADSDAADIED